MGVSYSHRVTIKFNQEDDCYLFHNYLQRLVTDNHLNRTSGYDIDNYTVDTNYFSRQSNSYDPEWYLSEIFDHGFDIDNNYIYFDIDDYNKTVVLDSCGYGPIKEFIIGYALEKYNAVEFYSQLRGCQGQERSNISSYYNKSQNEFECMFIPDWVSNY